MTSWQRVLLIIASMAFVMVCHMTKSCGEHPESVEHLAYAIVGFVSGITVPGMFKGDKSEQA